MILAARPRSGRKWKRGRAKIPPNPLPFCPPERKLSEISVRIFFEKSSDFVQDRQPSTFCRRLKDFYRDEGREAAKLKTKNVSRYHSSIQAGKKGQVFRQTKRYSCY